MIKTPVVVKTEEDFDGRPIDCLFRKQVSTQVRFIFRSERNTLMQKDYGYDESESCRWGRDHCCDRWRRRAASG